MANAKADSRDRLRWSHPEDPHAPRSQTGQKRLRSDPPVRRQAAVLVRFAGPFLIVACALFVLRRTVFQGLIPSADVLHLWLPTYCLMGKSLAAGHILGWNPYVGVGAPFTADPQSGWASLPVMALFSLLPCSTAIVWMIALQPLLAGLGLYAFCRAEGLSRVASTVGGLTIAMTIAASGLAMALPFAASLAWTSLLLACAARAFRAGRRPSRPLWLLLAALCWGQLGAAHFSTGMVVGTLAFVIYVAVKVGQALTADRARSTREVFALPGLMALSFPLVNAAYLLPRIMGFAQTTLGIGYDGLQRLGAQVIHARPAPSPVGPTASLGWLLKLALAPGAHVAAIPLAVSFAGLWSRRRSLAAAFLAFGALCYVLSLRPVAALIPSSLWAFRPFDIYLHSPQWFGYGTLLAIALLSSLGIEAWTEAAGWRRRAAMVLPGMAIWGVLPLALGAPAAQLRLLLGGTVAGGFLLLTARRRPLLLAGIPIVVAAELLAGTLSGGAPPVFGETPILLKVAPASTVRAAEATTAGPIIRAMLGGQRGDRAGRYLVAVNALSVPYLSSDAGMLFGLSDLSVYNSVQPLRFWAFTQAVEHGGFYQFSVFWDPSALALNLGRVAYLIAGQGSPPPAGAAPVVTEGTFTLFRLAAVPPAASVVANWTVVRSPQAALDTVLAPGFDPGSQVVLEHRPAWPGAGTGPGAGGRATWHDEGPQAARTEVVADRPSVVLIRTGFDRNWHAALDGRPAPILRADYLLQAVSVPAGRHVIALSYDDPSVGLGLLVSAIAILMLVGLASLMTFGAVRLPLVGRDALFLNDLLKSGTDPPHA